MTRGNEIISGFYFPARSLGQHLACAVVWMVGGAYEAPRGSPYGLLLVIWIAHGQWAGARLFLWLRTRSESPFCTLYSHVY